jgi:hypothetical protein
MAGESARAAAHTGRDALDQGAAGEEAAAHVLGALSAEGWRIFHDVRWPGRAHAHIDHVLVGPGGVFVIDALVWTGEIEVRSGSLRLDGRRRARQVIASAAAAMAIGELLPSVSPKAIRPVLCFAREEPIYGWSGDVMICSTDNVAAFLTSSPRVLDEAEMTEIAEVLAISLQCASQRIPAALSTYAGDTSSTAPRREPRRDKRPPRAPLRRPVRAAAVVGVLAVAVAVAFQLGILARLGELGASAAHRVVAPTKPIGTAVTVPGLGSRPSLQVTAGTPRLTRSKLPGVKVMPGNQLVAIPVSVHNTGDKAWKSTADVQAELTDTSGATYSSDPAYTSVRGGEALPATITLPAEQRTSGLVVFEVPRGVQVAKFQLRVGPALPTTLKWSVG